jgi:hypothetical protein
MLGQPPSVVFFVQLLAPAKYIKYNSFTHNIRLATSPTEPLALTALDSRLYN